MPRRLLALAAVIGGALFVPVAAADAATTATSTNWSGYAVARSGVTYKRVAASWTVPAVTCTAGQRSYSANWVGLGGSSSTSAALEQIGTEADCSSTGHAFYSAWYELVPSASAGAKLKIHAGDTMTASVAVSGHLVRLRLADTTHGTVFTKTLRAAVVDVSSAEWIVEAPALCSSATISEASCQVTPLANFATTTFANAAATTTTGHTGSITDTAWKSTAIALQPETDRRFAARGNAASTSGGATPGTLTADGAGFAVTYAATTANVPAGGGDPGPVGSEQPSFPGREG